jgi:hypothetical protein
MRVFIGSSGEQVRLVNWLTSFMRRSYARTIEPVPWTIRWPGGSYTLEHLLQLVDETDAAILFWTPDDKTWYRDTPRNEPRDNLVFEAGLFIAKHGRERTQIMIPSYPPDDPRSTKAVPTDVQGLTLNYFNWVDGPIEAGGLPDVAGAVCDQLSGLGPRLRRPLSLANLVGLKKVSEIRTFVGDWGVLENVGIIPLLESPEARSIDILASYSLLRLGPNLLNALKTRDKASLRACFANMWDDALLASYRRKYYDRAPEQIRAKLEKSIKELLGPCEIHLNELQRPVISAVEKPPTASYNIRLTDQRITFGYYRIDDVAFLVPLDMKLSQNPAPMAWVLDRGTAPEVFDNYLAEYNQMFREAYSVFSGT